MDVGICAFDFYFPKFYVDQQDLEKFDGVSSGKYTTGLALQQMAFCWDDEDINSLALTVTSNLLAKYSISPSSVGYLEVGTETLVDKCKTIKSTLFHHLFSSSANTDIHGTESIAACFAGTQSLFNATQWIKASWEVRKQWAIVVCADIAVYEKGSARPTGGAGAVAFLIGPNAPLVVEDQLVGRCVGDVYDFYKPIGGHGTEYPHVDGALSIKTYFHALDKCYEQYRRWAKQVEGNGKEVGVRDFHTVLFHAPFCKLVQKAFARMIFTDHKRGLVKVEGLDEVEEGDERAFAKATIAASQSLFDAKVAPNLEINRRLGNMYTASVYAQLVNLVANSTGQMMMMHGERILLYSYGGGFESGMFSIRFNHTEGWERMKEVAREVVGRLDERERCSPERYTQAMQLREDMIKKGAPYTPVGPSSRAAAAVNGHPLANGDANHNHQHKDSHKHHFPGTYYLSSVNKLFHRSYEQKQ